MELKNTMCITLFCLLATTLSSCYNVLSDDVTTAEHTPRLVVNGLITNEELVRHFVRLSLTTRPTSPNTRNYTPVTNATVTIRDDQGNVSVLYQSNNKYSILDGFNDSDRTWADMGYYFSDIRGVPGRTYKLTIVYNGQTYEASATMPQKAPELELKYEDDYELPFVYFDEPQDQKNYYLFYYNSSKNGKDGPRNYWRRDNIPRTMWSIFALQNILYDDTYLPAKVERLNIYQDLNRQTRDSLDYGSATVEMHSVTKEVYDLFQALEQQKENDGGAFSSLSANLPSNISNGALGFFRASATSRKEVYLNY